MKTWIDFLSFVSLFGDIEWAGRGHNETNWFTVNLKVIPDPQHFDLNVTKRTDGGNYITSETIKHYNG